MDQRKAQHTGFREVLAYITPHRNMLVAIVILLLLGSLLSLAGPWLAGKLTASLLAGSAAAVSPLQLLVLWFALMSVRAVLDFFTQYHIGYTGERMTMGLRNRLYEHMQALPLGLSPPQPARRYSFDPVCGCPGYQRICDRYPGTPATGLTHFFWRRAGPGVAESLHSGAGPGVFAAVLSRHENCWSLSAPTVARLGRREC